VSPRDWRRRVEDILDAVAEIRSFVAGMTFDEFSADPKTIRAVTAGFAIIGEAARHVPDEIIEAHPGIPWRVMTDMRNRVVHDYFSVDPRVLWETIRQDFPPLVGELQKLVERPIP